MWFGNNTAQKIGQLSALITILDKAKENSILVDTFIEEIMATNAIEGEFLNYDSVRS